MYSYEDILSSYAAVGVERGRIIYVTGNFGRLGEYQESGKNLLLNAHLSALRELLGASGTLVVPTHTFSLCNTDNVFDLENTKSETGPFTDLVRRQPGAVRQLHPYSSVTALGYNAAKICQNTSRHVYGGNSPFQRMVDNDALFISVGQNLERTIALIHHIEFIMGVPYRYVKEFVHRCIVDGVEIKGLFYLHVLRRECDIERDRNEKIMRYFRDTKHVEKRNLGKSFVESLSMKEFYAEITKLFSNDLYIWLKHAPEKRPYRL